MSKNVIETLIGALVLGVAAWFLVFFMEKNTSVSIAGDHYSLIAKFEQADGISVGTPVRIGGVKIGVVTSESLDHSTYSAVIKFSLDKKIQIPTDSTAKISSEGLIGGKYLSIVPGADDKMLNDGEELRFTQSSINLETLIGKMIFSKESDKEGDKASEQSKEAVK
jgi:phospholipid/cholesterol/gamma-HCH transport system substrate-binding protein